MCTGDWQHLWQESMQRAKYCRSREAGRQWREHEAVDVTWALVVVAAAASAAAAQCLRTGQQAGKLEKQKREHGSFTRASESVPRWLEGWQAWRERAIDAASIL
jgi:hypothetical protein